MSALPTTINIVCVTPQLRLSASGGGRERQKHLYMHLELVVMAACAQQQIAWHFIYEFHEKNNFCVITQL